MHSPFVLNIKNGNDITDVALAESFAIAWLDSEGFASSGYFSGGKCDWYEIGGNFTELFDGLKAIEYVSDEKINKLCSELIKSSDYIDTNYDVEVNLEEGDWLVMCDYHS